MSDVGDGFFGLLDIVTARRRGCRRWPKDVTGRIVVESLQPGARVVDVARRYDLTAHHLSDWRKQARDGLLTLPAELMPPVLSAEPAFVPLSIAEEPRISAVVSGAPAAVPAASGMVMIEIGTDLVMKVPDDVSINRVAALVRAMRGAA